LQFPVLVCRLLILVSNSIVWATAQLLLLLSILSPVQVHSSVGKDLQRPRIQQPLENRPR
jgi:hypothetical protein